MKAQDELNALLLLAKNYERLKDVKVHIHRDDEVIQIENVPSSMIDHFAEKLDELANAEVEKAVSLVEQAAQKYAARANNGNDRDRLLKK